MLWQIASCVETITLTPIKLQSANWLVLKLTIKYRLDWDESSDATHESIFYSKLTETLESFPKYT